MFKLIKEVSERNLQLAITGKLVVFLSIGSIFSLKLVKYGYFILLISVLLVSSYAGKIWMSGIKGIREEYSKHVFGALGVFLFILFVGIQSPQLPIKVYILIFGILLTVPAFLSLTKR